jgi:hypothetical protein
MILAELIRLHEAAEVPHGEALRLAQADLLELSRTERPPKMMSGAASGVSL